MIQKLKYSVLRYSPSMVSGESINLGVLFTDVYGEYRDFIHTLKWNRIKEFDDELDIEILKIILTSIKDEVSRSIFNINKQFDIDRFVSYYTNEYHFDRPIEIDCEDIDEEIQEATKLYLRYDFDKKQRPSREQEISFISKLLRSKKVQYRRNASVSGRFNEKIVYDYCFQDYGIKIFHLKNDSMNRIMNDIKAWAWNCENNQDIKTLILYEFDSRNKEKDSLEQRVAIDILKSSTRYVYDLETGISQLNALLENKVSVQV